MKKNKTLRRFAIVAGSVLVLFLGALIALPILMKDDIVAAVKDAANDNLKAKVDFNDVSLSLLRNFPNLTLAVEDLKIEGVEAFEGVPFFSSKEFGITVDFWSAWNYGKEPLNIRSLWLEQPDINILVLSDGRANYDIALPSEDTTTTETAFSIQLQEYAIRNGHVRYEDRQGGVFAELTDLNHEGKGDFTQDVFDLSTNTSIGELTAESGGVTYLKKAHASLVAGFNIDLPNMKFTLRENDLRINELQLLADGWVAMPDEQNIDLELSLSAPQNDFRNLLSMVPNAYIEGYENVKADGSFEFSANAKGRYSSQPESYPAFDVKLVVKNANVQYPDLPVGISDINMDMAVNSPGADLDKMTVDIADFKLKVGNEPISGYFKLKTPISDPDVDSRIKGKLDLAKFAKAYPMEGVESLAGVIDADVMVKTRMSTIDRGDYANVQMNGKATVQNLQYVAEGLPPVSISSAQADFTPRKVEVPQFDMQLGKSDLRGSATINNILAYFSPEATMKGDLVVRSSYFNADEWLTEEEPTEPASGMVAGTGEEEEELFNRFDFAFDGRVEKLDYDIYQLTGLEATGRFTPNHLLLTSYKGQIGDSDFAGSGELTNVWNYVFYDEVLGGEINFRSAFMNLNQFMTEEPVPAGEEPVATEPILVPENVSMIVHSQIGKVLYDDMELTDVRGDLIVADQQVRFDGVKGQLLGGGIEMKGGYDTREPEKPAFDLAMKLQQMDFQKTFNAFNTVQAIAPIGKYLRGSFNTEFSMKSLLTKDLMPDLNSLDLDAFIQTSTATIAGFAPLEEVANKLNVEELKTLVIKESKNWFTVKNGTVTLEDFDYTYNDIPLHIGGQYKITGEMDYKIIASIPREKIGKNPVGGSALSGLDYLSSEASKLGVNINAGDFINVEIGLAGSLTQPKVKLKVLGSGGKSSLKDAVASSVKTEANKQLDSAKAEVKSAIEEEKKQVTETAAKALEETKKAVDTTAKKVVEDLKKGSTEEAKKTVDEAKKKVEDINPFKKKKKGGG
ncbi:MAG: hypothetical protein Kow0027_00020 [Saprospiraceae bacterium]